MYLLRGDRGFNFCGCRGKLLPALNQHPASMPAGKCPHSQHPQSAQHFMLKLRCQLPFGLQAVMEYGRSSPFSPSSIAIYRLKSVSLMFCSVKSCSMHNQSFSALLEVPRCSKSTPKVEQRVNAQPESAAVALHVWQCPYMKRRVLLPSSRCQEQSFLKEFRSV